MGFLCIIFPLYQQVIRAYQYNYAKGLNLFYRVVFDLNHAIQDCIQFSNIIRTLVGNKFVDYSDVVGASPIGVAPATSSFSS